MKKLFFSFGFGLIVLSLTACSSVDDGACCENSVTMKKNIVYKDPTPVEPTGEEVPTQDTNDTENFLPPVAVIGHDRDVVIEKKETEFDCADSYDQDENGAEIVECIWNFRCVQIASGKTCDCAEQRGTPHDIAVITPPKAAWADYVEVTLTVVDDENQTSTIVKRYDIVE